MIHDASIALVAAALLPLSLAACGESPQGQTQSGSWAGSIDTTASGRVSVENTGGGAWTQDTVRARRTLLVGSAGVSDASRATAFGDIISLAVDSGGGMYVGDRMSNTVRAFGPKGVYLGLVGGEGQGPGEFRVPQAMTFSPDGRLYVLDLNGVTVLKRPAADSLPVEPVETWQPTERTQAYRPFRVTCGGIAYHPHFEHEPTSHLYLRLNRDGAILDTIHIPSHAELPSGIPNYRIGPGGGRMIPGIDHPPLAPLPSWDITLTGDVLIGESGRYRLVTITPTRDTARIVRRHVTRRPIPEHVRQDSADALQTRLDTLPVPIEEVRNLPQQVADLDLPQRFPAHLGVRVGQEGRIWVERPHRPERPGTTPFDVFDRTGIYLGTVVVPGRFDPGKGFTNVRMRPRPLFTESAVYGIVRDSVTGVQRLARFSFKLPDRESDAPRITGASCPEQAETNAGK